MKSIHGHAARTQLALFLESDLNLFPNHIFGGLSSQRWVWLNGVFSPGFTWSLQLEMPTLSNCSRTYHVPSYDVASWNSNLHSLLETGYVRLIFAGITTISRRSGRISMRMKRWIRNRVRRSHTIQLTVHPTSWPCPCFFKNLANRTCRAFCLCICFLWLVPLRLHHGCTWDLRTNWTMWRMDRLSCLKKISNEINKSGLRTC